MANLKYKIGLIGSPVKFVSWTEETVMSMKQIGFNALQLNIAWGGRPHDEPLNLEDVVALVGEASLKYEQKIPIGGDSSSGAWERRRNDLRERIRLCKQAGMRSIFHFGAPYNGQDGYRDLPLDNCLLDGVTPDRYVALLERFNEEFPGVDDLLLYTYDQDAWLCNEFGTCESCRGIPLDERVVPFVNLLARTWKRLTGGRLWWEPWELSAGQVLKSIEKLDADCVSLALHSNIAEVTATLPVDRFLKNAANLAVKRNIPFVVEGFFTSATEEVEPYEHIAYPLVTLRQLRAIAGISGAAGVKEYFGIDTTKPDPNLRVTELFFRNPGIGEDEALEELAEPYGTAAEEMKAFWRLSSESFELFPWDVSWFARKIGLCDVSHSMTAAFIRGQQCHTPSWDSTRRAIFMKTDDLEPDPWMIEDIQLRCELSAERAAAAIQAGRNALERVSASLRDIFKKNLDELDGFQRRAMSYAYHLRETNLVRIIRSYREDHREVPERLLAELTALLKEDQQNQRSAEPIQTVLGVLEEDLDEFLDRYFHTPDRNDWVKGPHSLTSR